MKCLALDLGTKTGYCIFEVPFKVLESGTQDFKGLSKGSMGKRFVAFRDWLIRKVLGNNINVIYYEDVRAHNGTIAAHVYGGFLYHLAAVCEDYNIALQGFGVTQIKKCFAGTGRASKEDMIGAARQLGFRPVDDNEADSIGIAVTSLVNL